jgi:hypothetical protein
MLTGSLHARQGKALQGNCFLRCLEAPYPAGRAPPVTIPVPNIPPLRPVDRSDVARMQRIESLEYLFFPQ